MRSRQYWEHVSDRFRIPPCHRFIQGGARNPSYFRSGPMTVRCPTSDIAETWLRSIELSCRFTHESHKSNDFAEPSQVWASVYPSRKSSPRFAVSASSQPSPQVTSELRSALRDKSNLIVAAAAAIVGDQNHAGLSAELEAAFDRCLVDPLKNDKLCRGKIAVIQALDKLEHERTDIFLRAANHVQLEPVWGGSEDTAAPLRAAAILALARLDYHGLLPLLVDSLTDSQKEVRIAAAQALGHHGSEPASLLLRLKARMGDKEPDVISECLSGLLTCSPKENLPFVSQFLDSVDTAIREAAILALGRSRLPEAFDLLKNVLAAAPDRPE